MATPPNTNTLHNHDWQSIAKDKIWQSMGKVNWQERICSNPECKDSHRTCAEGTTSYLAVPGSSLKGNPVVKQRHRLVFEGGGSQFVLHLCEPCWHAVEMLSPDSTVDGHQITSVQIGLHTYYGGVIGPLFGG